MSSNIATISEQELFLAFKKRQKEQLRKIHLFLNQHYHHILFNENEKMALDYSAMNKFKQIEKTWMDHEFKYCLKQYNCYQPIRHTDDVKLVLSKHPAFKHELFNYLQYSATRNDLKKFILSDSVLNVEFFDYLTFSLVGASDFAKSEIIMNLWDEAGRGKIDQFHTNLFKNCMTSLGLKYHRDQSIQSMSWEGLAGINLFNYLACYSHHKMKYYGLLAATEMLDPPHYYQLINGISRSEDHHLIDHTYYTEHEAIDVIHADGWLKKVIFPALNLNPDKVTDFWLGFYLRLDSAKRYFDSLLSTFTAKRAA